jgi:hypothetical protein
MTKEKIQQKAEMGSALGKKRGNYSNVKKGDTYFMFKLE